MSTVPTPQTAPQIGWRRLVGRLPNGAAFNYPHTYFAIATTPGGDAIVCLYNEATGANMQRPCNYPDQRAIVHALNWARFNGS